MPDVFVESALPVGWIPEGASVAIIAKRDLEGQWEALIPGYTIASSGSSPEEAVHSALELLDDYLVLCARDGRAFSEVDRPASWSLRFSVLRDFVGAGFHAKRRRPKKPGHVSYRVPLRLA